MMTVMMFIPRSLSQPSGAGGEGRGQVLRRAETDTHRQAGQEKRRDHTRKDRHHTDTDEEELEGCEHH